MTKLLLLTHVQDITILLRTDNGQAMCNRKQCGLCNQTKSFLTRYMYVNNVYISSLHR